jgi:predicted extracellular nuclease
VPLYGKFRAGQFDFVLVGVHLKSQLPVNSAENPAQCADDIRRAQGEDIIAALPGILNDLDDEDILIAGDFNASLSDSSLSPFLNGGGFVSLTATNRRAPGSNTISYLKSPHQEIIDHVLIRQASTTEWATRSTFIFNPPSDPALLSKYLKFTSDHAPAWSSFVTSSQ